MKIENSRTGRTVADRAVCAASFIQRLKGLLGRPRLDRGEALILPSCNIVHMFFMRFPIDVVFCSSDHRVLAVHENLQPWRISKLVLRASYVIEFPEATIKSKDIHIGDVMKLTQ